MYIHPLSLHTTHPTCLPQLIKTGQRHGHRRLQGRVAVRERPLCRSAEAVDEVIGLLTDAMMMIMTGRDFAAAAFVGGWWGWLINCVTIQRVANNDGGDV